MAPAILRLLEGQGKFYDPSELFIWLDNLPNLCQFNSIRVKYSPTDEFSNEQTCKIKEVIKNLIIIVETPKISKFQLMVAFEENGETYNSNIVDFINMRKNFFSTFNDINIAIIELKNIQACHKGDKEETIAKIEALNQCYQSPHEPGNSLFHDLLICDKISEIAEILAQYPELLRNAQNKYDESVLHYACRENKYEFIVKLMDLGLPLHQQDSSKSTPFHLAIDYEAKETIEVFQQILNGNEIIHKQQIESALKVYNRQGHTPLHLAVLNNQQELVVTIIKYCTDYNKLDICRMEVLGGGARITHLAKSKNLEELWFKIVEVMPEAVDLTDYADRTSTMIQTPKALRSYRHEPYAFKGKQKGATPKKNVLRRVENDFSQMSLNQNKGNTGNLTDCAVWTERSLEGQIKLMNQMYRNLERQKRELARVENSVKYNVH